MIIEVLQDHWNLINQFVSEPGDGASSDDKLGTMRTLVFP